MLYFKCPTCRTRLADKQLIYEKELEKACNDPKLHGQSLEDAKSNILDRLELKRPCCRMRTMTYNRLIDIIV